MLRSCARLPRGTSGELLDLGRGGTEENSSDARIRESAEAVADRKDRRRGARVDVDLLHHMLDMIAGRERDRRYERQGRRAEIRRRVCGHGESGSQIPTKAPDAKHDGADSLRQSYGWRARASYLGR